MLNFKRKEMKMTQVGTSLPQSSMDQLVAIRNYHGQRQATILREILIEGLEREWSDICDDLDDTAVQVALQEARNDQDS